MNSGRGKVKFKKFQILLDSGYSSTIAIGRLFEKLFLENDAVMQWHTQAINITSNFKFKVFFALPALIATNFVT